LFYRYRLLGVDADWQLAPLNLPVAAYTQLPPGRYAFEVEASVDREHWSSSPLALEIEQLPGWWQRPWLRYGLPLALLLLAALGVWWRLRALAILQRAIEAVVEERTAELRASNAQLEDLNRLVRAQSAVFQAQASTDPLTQLPNRRAFEQRVDELLAGNRGFVLGLVDIDHFKQINDRFSHTTGDAVLAGVAEVLRKTTGMPMVPRPAYPFVARWGGEEFALLWPFATLAESVLAAERVRTAVLAREWGELLAGEHITISIGLAERQPDQAVGEV
jgi:diguanylate cyclase (GGDEF)-like protein